MDIVPLHPNSRTREEVRVLSGMGAPVEFISHELNLTPEQLTEYYQVDLEAGPAEANARVARAFFDMATSGDHPALTLAWMKMRAGWADTPASRTDEPEADLASSKDRLLAALERRPDVLAKLANAG